MKQLNADNLVAERLLSYKQDIRETPIVDPLNNSSRIDDTNSNSCDLAGAFINSEPSSHDDGCLLNGITKKNEEQEEEKINGNLLNHNEIILNSSISTEATNNSMSIEDGFSNVCNTHVTVHDEDTNKSDNNSNNNNKGNLLKEFHKEQLVDLFLVKWNSLPYDQCTW